MKKIFSNIQLISLISFLLILSFGCSSEPENKTDNKAEPKTETQAIEEVAVDNFNPQNELLTVEDTIEYILNDAMLRSNYKDNSGFYDNEFSYLTDETTFDEYLKFGQITYEHPNKVLNIDVTEVVLFRPDSAMVAVDVLIKGPDGKEFTAKEAIPVYFFEGRWIKPTVSVISHQVGYEEKIRQAIEAADDE